MKKHNLEFSKALIFVCGAIFIGTLLFCLTRDYTTIIDTAFYVSAITISGSVFLTSVVNYLKKAQAENAYKIQNRMYENVMKVRLSYNEEMLKLRQKYNVPQEEIGEIEMESPIDDMSDTALSNMQNAIENSISDAISPTEQQIL